MRFCLAALAVLFAVPCSPAQEPPKKKGDLVVADKDKVKMDAALYADDQMGRIIDADAKQEMKDDFKQ